ncbi:hypothetical protein ACFB49_21080 [Sphingomonas sp. DBB INV C78]
MIQSEKAAYREKLRAMGPRALVAEQSRQKELGDQERVELASEEHERRSVDYDAGGEAG